MEDRINIDGVWYVKEKTSTTTFKINEKDLANTISSVYEDDKIFLRISSLVDEDSEQTFEPWLEITDKLESESENIDNLSFLKGILKEKRETMEVLYSQFNTSTVSKIVSFVNAVNHSGHIKI